MTSFNYFTGKTLEEDSSASNLISKILFIDQKDSLSMEAIDNRAKKDLRQMLMRHPIKFNNLRIAI